MTRSAILLLATSVSVMAQGLPQGGVPQGGHTILKGPGREGIIVACASPVAGQPSPSTECCPTFRMVYMSLSEEDKRLVFAAYEQYCTVPAQTQLILNCFDPTSCCNSAKATMQYYTSEHYRHVKEFSEKFCTLYDPNATAAIPSKRVTMPPAPTGR